MQRSLTAEATYRSLVEQLPAITYRCVPSPPYTDTYTSPQLEALLGFTPAEWLAEPGLWARRLHPEDRDRVLARMEDALGRGEPYAEEYRLIAKDGRVCWVDDAAVLVHGADGQSGEPAG